MHIYHEMQDKFAHVFGLPRGHALVSRAKPWTSVGGLRYKVADHMLKVEPSTSTYITEKQSVDRRVQGKEEQVASHRG